MRHPTDLVEALLRFRIDGSAQTKLHQALRFVLRDERPHHFFGFGPEPATPHHGGYPGAESPGVDRLVQHVVDALRQKIVGLSLGTCRRHDDDRDVYQSHHRPCRVHNLSAIENRELETDNQCVGRILRQNAECGGTVVGDLHGEPRFDQDVVEPHAIGLVTDSEKYSRRLRHAIGIEIGNEFSIHSRRGTTWCPAPLELGVRNDLFRRGVAFSDVPERVVIERMKSARP